MVDRPDDIGIPPELFDLCGTVIRDRSDPRALGPEASSMRAREPGHDGRQVVVAFSREHVYELVKQLVQAVSPMLGTIKDVRRAMYAALGIRYDRR